MEYKSLNEMLNQNSDVKKIFDGLPDYVRDQIASRGDSVNTVEGLRDYAENLLRGDD